MKIGQKFTRRQLNIPPTHNTTKWADNQNRLFVEEDGYWVFKKFI